MWAREESLFCSRWVLPLHSDHSLAPAVFWRPPTHTWKMMEEELVDISLRTVESSCPENDAPPVPNKSRPEKMFCATLCCYTSLTDDPMLCGRQKNDGFCINTRVCMDPSADSLGVGYLENKNINEICEVGGALLYLCTKETSNEVQIGWPVPLRAVGTILSIQSRLCQGANLCVLLYPIFSRNWMYQGCTRMPRSFKFGWRGWGNTDFTFCCQGYYPLTPNETLINHSGKISANIFITIRTTYCHPPIVCDKLHGCGQI